MRIVQRYIWREYFQQFMICGAGFTVLGIGKIFFDYNDIFIGYRLTPVIMFRLLLDQIPALMMDVLPAATLFGIILAMGRLLRERELDVLRICGVSLVKIMMPLLTGVALICFSAYWWNDLVVPSANHSFESVVRRLSVQEDLPILKENIVFKGPQNRFIYLNKVNRIAKKVTGIIIFEASTFGKWPRLITAREGRIHKGVWELDSGTIHELDQNGAVKTELKYQKMMLRMSLDYSGFIGESKGPSEMRTGELLKLINLYKRSGMNVPIYAVYYHSKFADPIISLVFVLLAVPMTILTGRNSRWIGLVWCFLIIMGYYAMQVIGRTMGANSLIAPWEAAWIPHLVFLAGGIAILVGVEQRR